MGFCALMKRMARFFSMRGFWGRIFSFGVRFLELFVEFGLICAFNFQVGNKLSETGYET